MTTKFSIISTLLEALRLGRRYAWLTIALGLVSDIPNSGIDYALTSFLQPHSTSPTFSDIGLVLAVVASFVTVVINLLVSTMVTAALLGVLKTSPRGSAMWQTIRASIRTYTWRLFRLAILLMIIASFITIPFSLIIGTVGFSWRAHSYVIQFLVMLTAILYLIFVKYALADPLIVIEEMGPVAALKRSWQMTRGRFWYVLGCYVFVGAAEYFIGALFQRYETNDRFDWVKAADDCFTSVVACYWILLAWCMYWRIKATELPA